MTTLLFLALAITVFSIGVAFSCVRTNVIKRKETINMLAEVVVAYEAKSVVERGHSRRVAEVSYFIAGQMNLGNREKELVRVVGLLHDIGKIGIEDCILGKDNELSYDETEIVKKHVEIGKSILEKHSDFAKISEYVYMHHERPDGKGYPQNKKNIPRISAIVSVADAMDAILTRKDNVDFELLKDELIKNKDTQFDGAVVDTVLSNYEDIKLLYKKLLCKCMDFATDVTFCDGTGEEVEG